MKIINGIPRRRRLDLLTPAEVALKSAIAEVDRLPPSKENTDMIISLQAQFELLADYIESKILDQ